MKAPSRRDRIRAQLADLKMPGALEALGPGALRHRRQLGSPRPRRSSHCSEPRSICATTAGSSPPCAPADCRR